MKTFWYILIGLAVVYYTYVAWVLLSKKEGKNKKPNKIFAYLRLNNKFVNKSEVEQTELEAVLDQISKVEDTSKLLEAFKEGPSDDDSNSLTRKTHEKLKIIRNSDTPEDSPPGSKT